MIKGFKKIYCVIQRGGTSKGVYIHGKDLPSEPELREKIILAIGQTAKERGISLRQDIGRS